MENKESLSLFQLFRFADRLDKWLLFFGILGSIGDGLMNPLTMVVLSGVITEYGNSDNNLSNQIVDKYALRLLYVALGVGVAAFVEGLCWTRTAERQASRMRNEYLKSVLRQDVGFFDTQAGTSITFDVVSTISSDAHSIQDVIADKIPNYLAHVTSFIICLVVAFLLSWRLALAALPFSLMFIIPGVGFGKMLMDQGMKMKDAYGLPGGIAEQAISSVRTVFAYVGEHQTLERFSKGLQQSKELGIKIGLTKGLLIGSMGTIFASWAFLAWVGTTLIIDRGEKGGAIFATGCSLILGGMSLMSALPNITFFSVATAAATRIYEMVDRLPAIDLEDEKGKVLAYVRGDIEFKDVHFSYPSRPDTPILQGFSLKVPAGNTVGLVGGSGSGKSTVISMLERFYDPSKGDIYLDGNKIRRLQLKSLRSQIGLVNQEPVLFATSIKENILFGKEGATMELVIEAAKDANAHDFIIKLPDGYETQVGQFGVQLSGGQKQRIAIARALVRDPRILLFDEATSALDAQSERIVQEALDQASLGRTTIMIAHRLSTIRKANLIVVVQSGKVVESGSHDELIKLNNGEGGAYSKMLQLQKTAVQNETSSPHIAIADNNYHRMMIKSMMSPVSVRSSRQISPAYPLSPAYSISQAYSFVQSNYENPNEGNLDLSSKPPAPSQWRLLKMNAPEWKRAFLGCLGAVGFGAVQPGHFFCLGTMISVFFLKDFDKLRSETRFYCFMFLLVAVLCLITNLLLHYNFAIMGERLTKRIREKLLEKVLTFEIGWFDQDENTSAAICARLATEANIVRSLVGDRISLLVQAFTGAAIAFVLGLVLTWRLASVMIAMQPILIASYYSRTVLMASMSEKAQKAQNEGSQLASEAVVNHRTITAFSSQKRILDLFEGTMEGPRKESIKQSWYAGIGLFSSQFLTTASIAMTYWYGGRLLVQGLITTKRMFQAFFILLSTGKNIADAGSMTSDLAKGSDAIRSVFAILDRRSMIIPDDPEGIKPKKAIKGRIELKNVYFSYPSRPNQMIFNGLSLKIEAGKTVALVGQSGSGKSTTIALIERFYDPLEGSVEIDEQDIRSYNLRSLRSHIALVSQEPTLFAGTIRENILYGKENATEAELRRASSLANAHEFISSMKDGYETYCGERGVQLSGGQKQRIALARAILKNPAILLLDEATSALDSVSENLVQEALEKMMVGRTCVVVAHRLSTIQKSDSISVIKNGKVVEQGSHSELLSAGRRGSYYSLIKLQGNNSPYR
ncbi:ABC transporter [Macleaya cordata]|uniref:ABC transporter n=1 Tax=Macleaya cordata TaxID=56857 RepID=A0A200RCU2_MACCD|nr:ABC transporter [Macleaya cordata]